MAMTRVYGLPGGMVRRQAEHGRSGQQMRTRSIGGRRRLRRLPTRQRERRPVLRYATLMEQNATSVGYREQNQVARACRRLSSPFDGRKQLHLMARPLGADTHRSMFPKEG
jgi:hypothetical protein